MIKIYTPSQSLIPCFLQAEKEEREAQEKARRAEIEAREAKMRAAAAAAPKKGKKK